MTDHALHADRDFDTTAAGRNWCYAAFLTCFTQFRDPLVF